MSQDVFQAPNLGQQVRHVLIEQGIPQAEVFLYLGVARRPVLVQAQEACRSRLDPGQLFVGCWAVVHARSVACPS